MTLTRSQITILHVAKSQLALDDETYRDALEAHGNARSARDLTYDGFRAVMTHFERCGFKRLGGRKAGRLGSQEARKPEASGQQPATRRPGMATERQIKKIYALWWSLSPAYYVEGYEYKALRGFLKKRFRVGHENWLDFDTAHNVIEAIKAIGARVKG